MNVCDVHCDELNTVYLRRSYSYNLTVKYTVTFSIEAAGLLVHWVYVCFLLLQLKGFL